MSEGASLYQLQVRALGGGRWVNFGDPAAHWAPCIAAIELPMMQGTARVIRNDGVPVLSYEHSMGLFRFEPVDEPVGAPAG